MIKKCKYVETKEDIERNKRLLLVHLMERDKSESGTADIGWYNSSNSQSYYRIKDFMTCTASDIKYMTKHYKLWYEREKELGKLDDNYVYNTLIEIIEILYNCGVSLKCNVDFIKSEEFDFINIGVYPIIYLNISDELKKKLLDNNICYIGEILKINFTALLAIIDFDEINELYKEIASIIGSKPFEKVLSSLDNQLNTIMEEKLIIELMLNGLEREKEKTLVLNNRAD